MYGDTGSKLILVCGYNGIQNQQHDVIIDSLAHIRELLIERVHLVVPLTYGATESYINNINMRLLKLGISYTLLTKFLSIEELATLRKTANIVVNIQTTDALAISLQDHLYCGNICIIGEWLKYYIYDHNKITYIKIAKETLTENIKYYVLNYNKESVKFKNNYHIMRNILSWDSVIKDWIKTYGE